MIVVSCVDQWGRRSFGKEVNFVVGEGQEKDEGTGEEMSEETIKEEIETLDLCDVLGSE